MDAATIKTIAIVLLQAALVYVCAQLAFDTVHYLLHRWASSRSGLLRWCAGLHQVHHDFYTSRLQQRPELMRANVLYHHVPEYSVQLAVCAAFIPFVHPLAVIGVAFYYTVLFAFAVWKPAENPHHLNQTCAKAPNPSLFDSASYHAYHHFFPDRYFASGVRLFDMIMGTGAALRGRRFAVSGTGGAFGKALAAALEKEGALVTPLKWGRDIAPGRYDLADEILKNTDVLVLTHGSMGDDMEESLFHSYVGLIERFRAIKGDALQPPEVWALGSEIELHPALGEVMTRYRKVKLAFAAHARRYYADDRILYRHIVPCGFRTEQYASRPIPASWLVAMALFFIRRGAAYVPASITGLAFVNFLRFRLASGARLG